MEEALKLWEYAREMAAKEREEKGYIQQQIRIDPNFVKPFKIREIVSLVHKKYAKSVDARLLISTTSLHRYSKQNSQSYRQRKRQGPPEKIPTHLLNTVRLHMKVQQLSKKGQASGASIKGILAASVKGTQHEEFNAKWAWERLRKDYPEDVNPTSVSQQESICNEWTTFYNVNDWFTENRRTLLESGLAKDEQMILDDGQVAELTMGKGEKR